MKKLLLSALLLTIGSVNVLAGERTAQGPDIYNINGNDYISIR